VWDDLVELEDPDACAQYPERVLVAVVPRLRDWELIRSEHWYRIPVSRAPRRIAAQYLAFYHPRVFRNTRWTISYYASVRRYCLARRRDLLPDEADHPRADHLYYKIEIGSLKRLPRPIPSRKLRRVTFIMTTMSRLLGARDVVDLWEHDGARDRLWRALRARDIQAHRDYVITERGLRYRADLAVLAAQRGMAVECVGHVTAPLAKDRSLYSPWDRIMSEHGWVLQCFSVAEILTDLEACVEMVARFVESGKGNAVSGSVGGQGSLGSGDGLVR